MSGDYTRVRYSAQSGYIGVLEQQGRVRLDADGNEQLESIDRRRRAECMDTIGHGVVPMITLNGIQTQDGFLIQHPAAGEWTIGAGRAYVDGILVDCWGDPGSQSFQPDLGELRGPNPLPFAQQPFYYSPSFPLPPANASSIVYLDVWEREVTALEDPGLIDPALEGIDTTTRLQVAWQVKALRTTVESCSDTPPEWQNLIAPSTGVLCTATVPAPASGSPCIIDPVAGYTGLMNQLYRVQVHRSGTVGGATAAQFIWSSENASLGAALLAITGSTGTECQLSVSTIGRDRTFGFNRNDTLEVLDDFVEWSIRETNTGGQFVTVTNVDAEQLTLTVTPDISSFAVVTAQHPRIRRWSAAPQPTQNGVALPLGTDGVTVTFGPDATSTLRAGDYWVFSARTATGTIEILKQAPPRGVLHHYMKLAVVPTTQPIQDCRQFWPPLFGEGCCTVVVQVGDDIQKAIDSLPKQGGCVCLKTGVHLISRQIHIIGRSNITLHGETIGAVVQNTGSGSALEISGGEEALASDISVERISFLVKAREKTIVQIGDAIRCAVRGCHLGLGTSNAVPTVIVGIRIARTDRIEILENQVSSVITGIMAESVSNLVVAGNSFAGPTSPATEGTSVVSGGHTAIDIIGPVGGIVSIQGNEIVDFSQGVVVQTSGASMTATALPLQLSIERNLVVRHGLVPGLTSDFGWPTLPVPAYFNTSLQEKVYAIFTDISYARIVGNTINLADPGHGGILVTGSGITVSSNVITSSVSPQLPYIWPNLPVGIVAYKRALANSADRCRIAENILNGPLNGIAVLGETLEIILFPTIADNRINNSGLNLSTEQIDLTHPLPTLDTLCADLIDLKHAFGILLITAARAEVVRNLVSTCTVGIAAISVPVQIETHESGITLDGNCVDTSTIGILVNLEYAVVQNSFLTSNQASIVLFRAGEAQVLGNRCIGLKSVVHCLNIGSTDTTRFEENYVEGGMTGIIGSWFSQEVHFIRNKVEATVGTGILVTGGLGSVWLEGNRLLQCARGGKSEIEENIAGIVPGLAPHAGWQRDMPVCSGIAVLNCSGVITIEGCSVTETEQIPGSWCLDIVVVAAAHVRVRSCRVVRTQDSAHTSRALFLYPLTDQDDPSLTSVDASGNHIDVSHDPSQQNDFLAAEIRNQITGEIIASSDIIFVGNLVIQRKGATGRRWIVALTAESLAITGNRIRREFQAEAPSLEIKYTQGLSYVGNVVTSGASILSLIAASLERPSPAANYNVPR